MKLKATYETEVYISDGGYLCIRQKDPLGNDDAIVVLSPEQATLIANEMLALSKNPAWWLAEVDEEDEPTSPADFVTKLNLAGAEQRAENKDIVTRMNLKDI